MTKSKHLKNKLAWMVREHRIARPKLQHSDKLQMPIVVAGLFSTANGIGRAARSTYSALREIGVECQAFDLSTAFGVRDMALELPTIDHLPVSSEGTLIMHLNAPETREGLYAVGAFRPRQWYTIGYWSWELAMPPLGWAKAANHLSEIWTLSNFCKTSISRITTKPVRVVPPFIHADNQHSHIELPSSKSLHCLIMADGRSSLSRKNVEGSLRAYLDAFSPPSPHRLTIKIQNTDRATRTLEAINSIIKKRSDIELVTDKLSDFEVSELVSRSDVLISLHRAEGFGMHLAEAMVMGKVIIATNWSGNCDFMTSENSVPIRATLTDLVDEYNIYKSVEGTKWADPDIRQASRALQELALNPDRRLEIGRQARRDIIRHCSASNYRNALFGN